MPAAIPPTVAGERPPEPVVVVKLTVAVDIAVDPENTVVVTKRRRSGGDLEGQNLRLRINAHFTRAVALFTLTTLFITDFASHHQTSGALLATVFREVGTCWGIPTA